MKNTLDKVVQLFKDLAKGEMSKVAFNKNEFDMIEDLSSNFGFLTCYPQDNTFYNIKLADKIIRENKVIKDIYYIGDKHYQNLIKNDISLKNFVELGTPYIPSADKNANSIISICKSYEKEDDILYEYFTVNANENIYITVTIVRKLFTKNSKGEIIFNIPSIIRPEEVDKYRPYVVKLEGDVVSFSGRAFSDKVNKSKLMTNKGIIGSYKQKNDRIDFLIAQCCLEYVNLGDKLVYKHFYEKDYQEYLKMKEFQTQFLVIDKTGEALDRNKISSGLILHTMRNVLSHDNMFNYKLTANTDKYYIGKVFKIDDRAVIIPDGLFSPLAHINNLNNSGSDEYIYVLCPEIKNALTNEEECREYLNSCRIIKMVSEESIDKNIFEVLVKHHIDCYQEKYENYDILQGYLKNKLKKRFNYSNFEVKPLANIELLLRKLMSNPPFFNDDSKENNVLQQKYIYYLLNLFYGIDLTKKYVISPNGKTDYINVDPKAFVNVLSNILKVLVDICNNNQKKNMFGKYRDEIYITLCGFLIYINLIYNNFDDDIDSFKSKLPLIERQELQSKLNLDMFSKFIKVDDKKKGADKESPIKTYQEMQDIVSNVRNSMAHSNLKIKYSKSNNPEDIFLVFKYYPETNRANISYKIKICDFIEFIRNPLFENYKPYNYNQIEASNFDELIKKVTEILN